MRPDDIRELLRRQPFQPFRIHLSNGTVYEVRHPELILVGRTTLVIGRPAPGAAEPIYEDFSIVALVHINHVEPVLPAAPPATP
jgi:hypothetical protein